jgi:hypothetical protein
MLLERAIRLELDKIEIVENPITMRGKFVAYRFKTIWPLESAFLNDKWPMSREDYTTVVWGNSPEITYYSKEARKIFEKKLQCGIENSLPNGFTKNNVTCIKMIIASYDSKFENRPWCLAYHAERYVRTPHRLTMNFHGRVDLENDFVNEIKSYIPEKITQWSV